MFMDRIVGVFKLDVPTFESIEHDRSATGQAAAVVALVALLAALGSGAANSIAGRPFLSGFLSTLIWTILGWVLWSVVSYLVGTTVFHGQATIDEMLRVIGFAYAPQVLSIIPCIGWLIGGIWSLIAGFIAIRQGLDLDNTKAFLTILIGFFVYLAGTIVLAIVNGVFRSIIS